MNSVKNKPIVGSHSTFHKENWIKNKEFIIEEKLILGQIVSNYKALNICCVYFTIIDLFNKLTFTKG